MKQKTNKQNKTTIRPWSQCGG